MALLLCLTAVPTMVSAEGDGEDTPEEAVAVATVSPAFQKKLFTELNADEKLQKAETMENVTMTEKSDKQGLSIVGSVAELTSGRFTILDEYDFDEVPSDRKTPLQPVGRISVDGLSDKKVKVTVNIYLDDAEEPCASMLLRRQTGSVGWGRAGDRTQDVLSQNITGKHSISIGLDIQGLTADEQTEVLLRSLTFCENSIPVMYFNIDESEGSIDAMNASENHDAECYGNVTLQVPAGYKGEFSSKELSTQENMELDYVRGRGNSTWGMDKKPYKVKFLYKQNLLGMGKSKHWVLLANRYDNTLLRNRVTYWIGRQLNQEFDGLETGCEFTPKCEPVEVVMNGNYYGSYLLSTQVRVEKNRVEVEDLEEDGKEATEEPLISGGYLVNLEGYEEGDSSFTTAHDDCFGIESPDFTKYPDTPEGKNAKAAQKNYLKNYFDTVENALYGTDLKDKDGHSFDEYLDEQSAIDYWWMQEFTINGDAFNGGSNYLYKRRDKTDENGNTVISKLHWGPLWDFDYVAWGNPNSDPDNYSSFSNTSHSWMNLLRTNEAYCNKLKARWSAAADKDNQYTAHLGELMNEVTKEGGVLDQYYEETRVSQIYDNYRWGFYNAGYEYGGYDDGYVNGAADQDEEAADQDEDEQDEQDDPQTYESEIKQFRSWIQARSGWVDENLDDIGVNSYTVQFFVDGQLFDSRKYLEDNELGTLPEAPEKEGYTFIGWYDTEYDMKVEEDSFVCFDFDVKAKYVKTSKLKKPQAIYFSCYDAYSWCEPSSSDEEDDAFYPSYTIMPQDAPEDGIKWSVSDPDIATVKEDGGVICRKYGTVTVTATLSSGKKNSYKLTFVQSEDDAHDITELSLNKKSLSVKTGSYTQIIADQNPKPHYQSDVEFIPLDSSIISVDSCGVVIGKKPGKTFVIAIDSESRCIAICQVTVTPSTAYRIKMAKAAKVKGVKAKVIRSGKKRTVRVSWKKKSGVSGYYVLRSTKKNGKYKRVGTTKKAGKVKWTDRKVKKGKTYYYKVKPFTKIGKKKYAGKLSAAAKARVR